jgi:uncharacterized damage-inducible protein DinB
MSDERADLLESIRRHRGFLSYTARDLTDEQAALTPTVSQLCIGGVIKHVTATERGWMAFAVGGAEAMQAVPADWENGFRMVDGETLASLLADYDAVAADTDKLIENVPDLDQTHPLPTAPWFEPGKSWSVRRVLLHLIAETSQHAGHADVIRETIDGSKTMG